MSFFHRLTNAFLLTSLASKVTLISLLFIISALPATLFLTKQNQDLRQRANVTGNGSACLTISVNNGQPVYPGESYTAIVTMRNDGDIKWDSSYKLGSQNPQDNTVWGLGRVDLPHDVEPNGEVTFNFSVTAPSTIGTNSFWWRMLSATDWFGSDCQYNVTVIAKPEPTTPVEPTCAPYAIKGVVQYVSNGQWTRLSGATVCVDNDNRCSTTNDGNYQVNNISSGGNGHNVILKPVTGYSITSQNPVNIDGFTCPDNGNIDVNFLLSQITAATATPTPTPTTPVASNPSSTPVPTSTGQGAGAPTATTAPTSSNPSPTSSTGTLLSSQLTLQGVINPKNQDKNITLCFYPINTTSATNDYTCSQSIKTLSGNAHFNSAQKNYQISFSSLNGLANGNYDVFVKVNKFLRKRIPQMITVQGTTPITLASITLANGDINNDNSIDTQDYSLYIACFGTKINTPSCTARDAVDINEDGTTDSLTDLRDYRILIQNIGSQKGD